ncbi:MAG TPA: methyltransferase domain-containing protein [Burkholderiaceae bacterium]|nr:methyltransferase domain-containing protein [Burkholderiaceae bacterium]
MTAPPPTPAFTGPAFYDDDGVFDEYAQLRARPESANDTLERPVIRELLGEPRGLGVVDLGCGDAAFGRELLAGGARSYLGVDGSANMVAAARATLAGSAGTVIRSRLEDWAGDPAAFERAVSRLALHYIADLDPVFAAVHRALRPGGRFVFSVEHPVITSCDRAYADGVEREDWIVDDYFDTGPRVTDWLGAQVLKHHRTVEDHVSALLRAGFAIDALRESRPQREHFASDASFARRRRIPLFLFLAASRR